MRARHDSGYPTAASLKTYDHNASTKNVSCVIDSRPDFRLS
jgi:hypothetical protein